MSDTFFFPPGSLAPTNARFDEDEFTRRWYSKHLRAMAEPSLSCATSEGDSFRFLWLRTFHKPITVRVDIRSKKATITTVTLSGAGGYEPGTVLERASRALSTANLESLQAAVQSANFWHLPTWESAGGADGSQWIVEARSGSRYHVVDRWSPTEGSFHALGMCFMKFGAVALARDEVY